MHLDRCRGGIYIITERARSQRAVLNPSCIVNMQFLQDKSTGSIVLLAYYTDLIKTIFTRTEYVSTEESNVNFIFSSPSHGINRGLVAALLFITLSVAVWVSFCHNHPLSEIFGKKKKTDIPLSCTCWDATHSLPFSKPALLSGHRLSIPQPSHSKHRGFIYTALMFLPSAHHIGGKV